MGEGFAVGTEDLAAGGRVERAYSSLRSRYQGATAEGERFRWIAGLGLPGLTIDQPADAPAGKRTLLRRCFSRRGHERRGTGAPEIAGGEVLAVDLDPAGGVAQVGQFLRLAAESEGLGRVGAGRSGKRSGQRRRRKRDGSSPAVGAHLVAREIAMQIGGAETKGEIGVARLPGGDHPGSRTHQIAEGEIGRRLPGKSRRAPDAQGERSGAEKRSERRIRDVCAPRQPPRALLWHLDLAAHSAGGAAGDESAPRNGRWPGGRALRRALAQRSAQGSPEPREQWRAGKRGTDGEQIVGERARGAGGRGPQPLAVEEQSGSEEAGGRGERDEGEEHVRSARFEEQLGRAAADGGLGRRTSRTEPRERAANLVHGDEDFRLAHAGGDVHAVDLDPENVEDPGALEPLQMRALEPPQLSDVARVVSPGSSRPDPDHRPDTTACGLRPSRRSRFNAPEEAR